MNERLGFSYWNTSLSPATGRKPTQQQLDIHKKKLPVVKRVVEALLQEAVDFLAVSEVNEDDLIAIASVLSKFDYDYLKATEQVGHRTRFDLGVFYKTTKIELIDHSFLKTNIIGNINKNALRIAIQPGSKTEPINLLIVHWASRQHEDPDLKKRQNLAYDLRSTVDNLLSQSQNRSYVIVMGDFNDEPFDPAVQSLNTTRDRGRVLTKPQLLYNPFWRHLGERDVFDGVESDETLCGTHFYPGGQLTRWRTLDQMMFSAQFLDTEGWLLDEAHCSIWYNKLLNLDTFKQYGFDHFPIMSRIVFRD